MYLLPINKAFQNERYTITDWEPMAKPLLSKTEANSMESTYQSIICQIDGGGILGCLPAYQLYTMEYNGVDFDTFFDTYFGCSTGAIIAALMNFGWSAKEVLKWYIEKGPIAFHKRNVFGQLFRESLYETDEIERMLKGVFGDITMADLYLKTGKKLHIATVDVDAERHKMLSVDSDPTFEVWAAVRASLSAPVYFPTFEYRGTTYVDGGTGNLSCLAQKAYTDALYVRKIPGNMFYIMSLGCGNSSIGKMKSTKIDRALWTFKYMRKEAVVEQERFLKYRQRDNELAYTRWNIDLPKELDSMDCTNNINELIQLVDVI